MSQTKRASLAETLFNTKVGFAINFVANLVILPWFGFDVKPGPAFHMGLIFTVISIVRGYCIRRLFNHQPFAMAIDRFNDKLMVPIEWTKNRLASAMSRVRSVVRGTTSPATTTDTAGVSAAAITRPVKNKHLLSRLAKHVGVHRGWS